MTSLPGGELPSPRAATTSFAVPVRQPTLEWSGSRGAGPGTLPGAPPEPPPPSPGDGGGTGRGRRVLVRRLGPAVLAAVVTAGTVWGLTAGPFGDPPHSAREDLAKASPTRSDTGWRPLEVAGGFVVTGDGARYRVVDGICYLQVHLRDPDGVWAANAPIAVLPASARPAWNHAFVASHDAVPYSEVGVYDDGQVLMTRPGDAAAGYLALSASFPVGD